MSSYHYSFYSPTDCTAWVFFHGFHCLLRIFSHRLHRFTQNFLQNIFSHRFHRFTQNFLLSVFSHRFHRFTQKLGCLQGGALVSSAPTKQEVHQPSKIDILPRNPQNPQNCLLSVFPHRFHRLTQIVWVPSRGCTCLKCTNQARSAPTKQNRYSPTESTEPTELLAECVLPQISQIYTDCLGTFKGVHLSQVHQPSNIDIPLVTLVHLRQVHP